MKFCTLLAILSMLTYSLNAQELNEGLLNAPPTWGTEIIKMPIRFAPEIIYQGVEEIKFAPGWAKQDQIDFWSYVFVWHITSEKDPSALDLAEDLEAYFTGLSDINDLREEIKTRFKPTVASLAEKQSSNNTTTYTGTVRTFDRFTSNEMITLLVTAEKTYCKNKKEMNIVFRFSPQKENSKIWEQLNTITLSKNACNF